MGHVVLLGDSIFDNARYVPDRPDVTQQVGRALPAGWRATLLAVDGATTTGVADQLGRLPADATHLVVSAGGNDALGAAGILDEVALTVNEALVLVGNVRDRFRPVYAAMLRALLATGKPVTVCTVYDAVPGIGPGEKVALGVFNEVILREAFAAGAAVIDLRVVCTQPADYSDVSSIEPSALGGAKIADAIARAVTGQPGQSAVYA